MTTVTESTPAPHYTYFDETYFQNGEQRGTAYHDYLRAAASSTLFRNIASAIAETFRPRRVLDVGCATGAIVSNLNDLGVEAFGIDVSEWAVQNRQHKNVVLAPAEKIPFPDGHFDLVMSCHAIEHRPDAVFDRGISEMVRVSSAFQFHMLPIVGTPPYAGDPMAVRLGLKKDPTHNQLQDREWWLGAFRQKGALEIGVAVSMTEDTPGGELNSCQFTLASGASAAAIQDLSIRATQRNRRIFRELLLAQKPESSPLQLLSYGVREWRERDRVLSKALNLAGKSFRLLAHLDGPDCVLRIAMGNDADGQAYVNVAEHYVLLKPGSNVVEFNANNMRTLRGTIDFSSINHIGFGGTAEQAQVVFLLTDASGAMLL